MDRAKILVAEDDPAMRASLVKFLFTGYEVLEAGDGAETLKLARKHRPDVVLLDIYMPKVGGVEILKELVPELPATAFIVVTGNDDEEVSRECLRRGAAEYICKPLDFDALGATIKTFLRRAGGPGR